ncbi:hypothetical protein CH63R_13086 [Colletotrichum higginsianum IMI 349063]|uniref:TeaA receptor TeaR n=3 Tax=Colletotrichum higginsianum TaxID=80884 RepID=A0A1B7XVZ9_COLHI|nr:hypothetical protein CH63R_13086 [Colletotrichum higginsianum IMI 349063]OBR03959.1 hypothetical protein CH63R_13086 [Colletotrichum higginsianum IMI 349063]TIC90228.1 hypothetical protein CH35J_011966 [Colletotrichum higginsianum]
MAAISAASATANTITPPSSSHGNGNQSAWNSYATADTENLQKRSLDRVDHANRAPLTQNGNSANIYEYGFEPLPPPRKKASIDNISLTKSNRSWDRTTRRDHDTLKTAPVNADDVFGAKSGVAEKQSTTEMVGATDDDKWIHRDKLAKIESQELQAAGIILPRARASSKPRRGRSEEKLNGSSRRTTSAPPDDELPPPRSRKSSVSPENMVPEGSPLEEVPSWDLRRPEEIEGDEAYWTSIADKKSGSKIPVAKASPAPIPEFYLERNAPSGRRRSGGSELETIAYPKPRPRSGSANTLGATSTLQPAKRNLTDVSPRKGSGGPSATGRKTSAQVKAGGKTRTRGGKDSTSSISGRPITRSADLSPGGKRPEGDPPWMIGSYRPDPRLPPEQQLLPTVAKRLQQEQWEREGKYGSIYDKEFRPLTADGLLKPPEAGSSTTPPDEEKQEQDEWPLKGDAPKSPTSPSIKQSNSYSTMPKISDKPQTSPLPSPRTPLSPTMQPTQPAETQSVTRVPDQPSAAANMSMGGEKKKKSGGCGCCIVM